MSCRPNALNSPVNLTSSALADGATTRDNSIMPTFSDVLDAADELSVDEQETLLEILRRRITARNRAEILRDVADAREELASGNGQVATAKQIVNEAKQ